MSHKALYEKHRPKDFSGIVGSNGREIARILQEKMKQKKLPHVILFLGSTGSGKTTLARILANMLTTSPEWDIEEKNMSDQTGVDDIRDIGEKLTLSPIGANKIFILDEIHNVSRQGQDALLKYTEDTGKNIYFILCTDSPAKLDKALVGRCVEYQLERPEDEEIAKLLLSICKKENIPIEEAAAYSIAEMSGDCRKAINNLEKLIDGNEITTERVQFLLSTNMDEQDEGFRLISLLMWPKFSTPEEGWDQAAPIMAKVLEKSQAQEVALKISGYCRNSLLQGRYKYWGNNKAKAKNESDSHKEFVRLNRILRIFARDLFLAKPENILVSLYIEGLIRTLEPIN